MLVLLRKVGEKIRIGDNIVLTVVKIERGQVKIGVDCDKEITVNRLEIHEMLHAGRQTHKADK